MKQPEVADDEEGERKKMFFLSQLKDADEKASQFSSSKKSK